ncbi:hypothetical protein PHLGIDRAFT_400546 [Phlebiopsis gigantea 11061_1 CR5-6]|uniref:F-box domain-containing protein n=1 Tax=Phlebiopsis gigantea (strain 11061_1 CR5-6) TaxID=745531 RepID=A0A0C3SFH1_PHLG1|nr:hypothetical protein PHLGIDRAFT_400546 [Phlebiopsis gigantea 11061_1 CR5-6]
MSTPDAPLKSFGDLPTEHLYAIFQSLDEPRYYPLRCRQFCLLDVVSCVNKRFRRIALDLLRRTIVCSHATQLKKIPNSLRCDLGMNWGSLTEEERLVKVRTVSLVRSIRVGAPD